MPDRRDSSRSRTRLKSRMYSRRQVLRRLGIAGAAGGIFAAGAGIGAWLRGGPRVVVLPHGAELPGASPARDWDELAIVGRADWGALPVDLSARNENGLYDEESNAYGWYVYAGPLADSYQTLVAHHSAFYEADGLATLREVQRLHRGDRGWADVGYHFLVDKDGAIYEGRDLGARGVHTQGHNTGSVGVCLLGDFRAEAPSDAQLNGFYNLSRWLAGSLRLSHLAAHNQFNPGTVCPGAALADRLPGLAARLGLEYGSGGYVPTARAGCDCCDCQSPL